MSEQILPYEVKGAVVHGNKRGRLLGFPTANLESSVFVDLTYGVYISQTKIAGRENRIFQSVSSFGIRPSFEDGIPFLETYILNFDGDIYGMEITVCMTKFIRAEQKFAKLSDLIVAIKQDVEKARAFLPVLS